jgi:glutathione peroxidase-family protein
VQFPDGVPSQLFTATATSDDYLMNIFFFSPRRRQVVLFVNLASACGLTPQYADLAVIYDKFSTKGFTIVGQPCNQVRDCIHKSSARAALLVYLPSLP